VDILNIYKYSVKKIQAEMQINNNEKRKEMQEFNFNLIANFTSHILYAIYFGVVTQKKKTI